MTLSNKQLSFDPKNICWGIKIWAWDIMNDADENLIGTVGRNLFQFFCSLKCSNSNIGCDKTLCVFKGANSFSNAMQQIYKKVK